MFSSQNIEKPKEFQTNPINSNKIKRSLKIFQKIQYFGGFPGPASSRPRPTWKHLQNIGILEFLKVSLDFFGIYLIFGNSLDFLRFLQQNIEKKPKEFQCFLAKTLKHLRNSKQIQ